LGKVPAVRDRVDYCNFSFIEFIMNTLTKVRNLVVAVTVASAVLIVPLSAQAKTKIVCNKTSCTIVIE